MKKLLMAILMVALFYSTAIVRAESSSEKAPITLSMRVWSERLSGYTGKPLDEHPVLQTNVNVPLSNGFSFSLCHFYGLGDSDPSSTPADEIDYTLRWQGKIEQMGADLTMGITYLDLIDLLEGPQNDLIRPYLEIGKKFNSPNHCLEPFINLAFPYMARGGDGQGFHARFGTRSIWKMSPEFKLEQEADLFFDDGAWNLDSGILGEYGGSLNWQISESTTIHLVSVRAVIPFTPLSDIRRDKIICGTGLSFRF